MTWQSRRALWRASPLHRSPPARRRETRAVSRAARRGHDRSPLLAVGPRPPLSAQRGLSPPRSVCQTDVVQDQLQMDPPWTSPPPALPVRFRLRQAPALLPPAVSPGCRRAP